MTRIDYASAGVLREPWGPVGFRWSVRSVVLIALVLLAGVWLRLRHLPYTAVTVLPVAPFFMGFHDDGRLVTADTQAGVRVWDVRTGKVVANPIADVGQYPDPRGTDRHHKSDDQTLVITTKEGSVQEIRPGRDPMIRTLPEFPNPPASPFFRLTPHEKYDVVMSSDHPGWRVHLRDKTSGAVWHSVPISWNYRDPFNIRLSRDGQALAVVDGLGATYFYDMASETMCAYYERGWQDIHFLPGSHVFFCFDPQLQSYAVFRVGTAQPLALVPVLESSDECPPAVSPDGRWMACGGPDVRLGTTILKRTGWDCLPSPKGMLVFPQTWLLAISVAGAAWSLRRDARRMGVANAGGRSPPYERWGRRLISGSVFVVLVVLTVHALLVVGLGRRPPMTAAPVLLIGWIGLGTGSRFWRMAAMVICAGALAWCVRSFLVEWRSGFEWSGSERVELLDRVSMWPRWFGMSGLAVGAMACGFAVGWFASILASDAGRERSGVS